MSWLCPGLHTQAGPCLLLPTLCHPPHDSWHICRPGGGWGTPGCGPGFAQEPRANLPCSGQRTRACAVSRGVGTGPCRAVDHLSGCQAGCGAGTPLGTVPPEAAGVAGRLGPLLGSAGPCRPWQSETAFHPSETQLAICLKKRRGSQAPTAGTLRAGWRSCQRAGGPAAAGTGEKDGSRMLACGASRCPGPEQGGEEVSHRPPAAPGPSLSPASATQGAGVRPPPCPGPAPLPSLASTFVLFRSPPVAWPAPTAGLVERGKVRGGAASKG